MTGIILSGGKNTRMGTNKAFLSIGGERLIDRTINLFKDLFEEVILVTNTPLDYLDHDGVIVSDIIREKGALGGIYSGLFFASGTHAFVAACDMPFLNKEFIRYMMERAPEYDIVVPRLSDGFQPLHAIYAKRCLPHIQKAIMSNNLKVTSFYRRLKILQIPEDVTKHYDPEGRMFFNVNTQEDLIKMSSFQDSCKV